jgi:hypothetical protein
MIAVRSLHRNSQQISRLTMESFCELCLISLARLPAGVTQDKKMENTQQNDEVSIHESNFHAHESNFRAEDGLPSGRSNALYEGVVVPLASLFAVFLFMLGAMVITH